jgi:hypothetical protein
MVPGLLLLWLLWSRQGMSTSTQWLHQGLLQRLPTLLLNLPHGLNHSMLLLKLQLLLLMLPMLLLLLLLLPLPDLWPLLPVLLPLPLLLHQDQQGLLLILVHLLQPIPR